MSISALFAYSRACTVRNGLRPYGRQSAGPYGLSTDILGHPGGNPGANLKSISHFEVAFVWELTKETIHLPLGCLQIGLWVVHGHPRISVGRQSVPTEVVVRQGLAWNGTTLFFAGTDFVASAVKDGAGSLFTPAHYKVLRPRTSDFFPPREATRLDGWRCHFDTRSPHFRISCLFLKSGFHRKKRC